MSEAIQDNGAEVRLLPPLDLAPLRFDDLTPIEIPVALPLGRFVLREASVPASIAYENAQARAIKFDDGKMSGLDGMYDADLTLLSMCLHPVGDDGQLKVDRAGNPQATPVETIRTFGRAYKPLVEKLKEISPGLEKKETPESLRKQIANLQKRLAELEAKETPAKN